MAIAEVSISRIWMGKSVDGEMTYSLHFLLLCVLSNPIGLVNKCNMDFNHQMVEYNTIPL